MMLVTLTVKLTLQGPILTASSAPGALGVDTPMAKTLREDGEHWALPFSLMRGKVRESLEQLGSIDAQIDSAVAEWFGPREGSGDPDDGSWEPQRGGLAFSDFIGPASGAVGTMTSIRIDPERQSVDTGAMHVFDKPFAPGKDIEFTGAVSYFAKDEKEANAVARAVTQGLAWTRSFGSEEGVGFGVTSGLQVSDITTVEVKAPEVEAPVEEMGFALSFLDPFCIAKRRISDNVFESADIIPGNVLKGAVAAMLARVLGAKSLGVAKGNLPEAARAWGPLCKHFDAIGFSHARPVKLEGREAGSPAPTVPPLSLVLSRDLALLRDAALHDGAFLLKTTVGEGDTASEEMAAPSFAVDWKEKGRAKAGQAFPRVKLRRELRVRTAIDSVTRRALDEQLFAYEMVVPFGFTWLGRIDLRGILDNTERGAVAGALRGLLDQVGLHGLGKSKARAKVSFPEFHRASNVSPSPIGGKFWVVTLQTPALLCDPTGLNEASGDVELHQAYDAAWADLSKADPKSPASLRLVRFFASQSLAGGYLVHRFQKDKPYNPFLLTDAGSVFVLEATGDGDAVALLKEWKDRGLPLPSTVAARFDSTWQKNPFLREHGFGEIVVNDSRPDVPAPQPGEYRDAELLSPSKEVHP